VGCCFEGRYILVSGAFGLLRLRMFVGWSMNLCNVRPVWRQNLWQVVLQLLNFQWFYLWSSYVIDLWPLMVICNAIFNVSVMLTDLIYIYIYIYINKFVFFQWLFVMISYLWRFGCGINLNLNLNISSKNLNLNNGSIFCCTWFSPVVWV